MLEETTELGLVVGAIVVGVRLLERFGDWAISKAKPMRYLSDSQDRRLYELHEWHKAVDPDTQSKLWYVPKSLGENMKEMAASQRDISHSQERILELLREIRKTGD